MSWGQIGPYYVLCIGDGAYAKMAAALRAPGKTLGTDAWLEQTLRIDPAERILAMGYLNIRKLAKASHAAFAAKVHQVADALEIGDADRVWVAVRLAGRAVTIDATRLTPTGSQTTVIARKLVEDEELSRSLPDDATRYAVLERNPKDLLAAIGAAYLSARSQDARQTNTRFWEIVEHESGVNIEKDILDHLDGPIMIHNHPRQVLPVPGAVTILFRIRGGDVPGAVDKLFSFARQHSQGSWVQLRKDPDGVWWLHYGLPGPALLVTEQWAILAYSPYAVRENARLLAPPQVSEGAAR